MRPTGALHLGHYQGVLRNWCELQREHECFFFVADWHALTTEYACPGNIAEAGRDMVIDWLAAGIDPGSCCLFVQSQVPEHAELHLLFSMFTPLSWLERVPSYKAQKENLNDRDLTTYGFLGYPLLQAADIILYNATDVPVGEDQVAHVELAREVARRFNHLYGREDDFGKKINAASSHMDIKNQKLYYELRSKYQEKGDAGALTKAWALIRSQQNLSHINRSRLLGYLEGDHRIILNEPQPQLTDVSCLPGTDGRKMSKSYNNMIRLNQTKDELTKALNAMPTDPARVRKSDPGNPDKCPVWDLHKVYTDESTRRELDQGCRTAGIGCLDCKKHLIEALDAELQPMRERRREYEAVPEVIQDILSDGREKARVAARETLGNVRDAVGLR